MDDIGLSALAQLALMGSVGIGEGVEQPLGIQIWGIGGHLVLKGLITDQNRVHKITSK
jgi:hypothetical protein